MKDSRTLIFCDFDGTIAQRDIGYHIFHHFSGGRNDALLPDWKAGRLSTRDCLRLEAEMVHASPTEFYRFLDDFTIDPTFPRFKELCRRNNTPLIVISEGLDCYIRYVLDRHGLGYLPLISNIGHLENNGLRVEFPHANATCRQCGSCKGERMAEYRTKAADNCQVIFVGDGYSDACAAKYADILLAKKDLVLYCDQHLIAYNSYIDFDDVTATLIAQGFLDDNTSHKDALGSRS